MRLFIAREALDPHLKVGGAIFNTTLPMTTRIKSMFGSGSFYSRWYPRQYMKSNAGDLSKLHADLRPHVQYGAATSKKLARGLFHSMMRFGPKLDREQLLLSRFVGVATEIFAMNATCSYAQHLMNNGKPADGNFVGRELLLLLGEIAHRRALRRHREKRGRARLRARAGVVRRQARRAAHRDRVAQPGTAAFRLGLAPVFKRQSIDLAEFVGIGCDQDQFRRQRVRRDQEIVGADWRPRFFELKAQTAGPARFVAGKRQFVHHAQEGADFFPLLLRLAGFRRAREEFETADGGNRAIIGRQGFQAGHDRFEAAQHVDASVCVE